MGEDRTLLRCAAVVEALTLTILLVNLATVHWKPVAALAGPVHGAAYLGIIAMTLLSEGAPRRVRLTALVPGIGGYLVLRRLRRLTTAP